MSWAGLGVVLDGPDGAFPTQDILLSREAHGSKLGGQGVRRHPGPRFQPGSPGQSQRPPRAGSSSRRPDGKRGPARRAPPAGGGPGISAAAAPRPQSRRAARPALAVPAPAPPPAAPRRRPPRRTAMIVESSRDAAPDGGDGGALSSPINLAYFYGASPHSSEGSCSPAHSSAPGSPGSDSDLSVSSRGGGRRDPRGGPRPALQGTAGPRGGPGPGGWRGERGAAGPAPSPRGRSQPPILPCGKAAEAGKSGRVSPALRARCRGAPIRAAGAAARSRGSGGAARPWDGEGVRGAALWLLSAKPAFRCLSTRLSSLFGCFFPYLLFVHHERNGWLKFGFCFRVSTVEQHMGGGKQHRGPFQGVRVKNSVKELLLHFRSSKQMSSGPATEESKVTGSFLH